MPTVKPREILLWGESGLWVQTTVDSQSRSSYVGKISLFSARQFAQKHGCTLYIIGKREVRR